MPIRFALQSPNFAFVDSSCQFPYFLIVCFFIQVHLLGTTLGGYLAQCYIQYRPHRVLSLILSNSFCDITHFVDNAMFQGLCASLARPAFAADCYSPFPRMQLPLDAWICVKTYASIKFSTRDTRRRSCKLSGLHGRAGPFQPIPAPYFHFHVCAMPKHALCFHNVQLESLSQLELSSRMALNCSPGPLHPEDLPISSDRITVIDVRIYSLSLLRLCSVLNSCCWVRLWTKSRYRTDCAKRF
jgi:hypothetical protein